MKSHPIERWTRKVYRRNKKILEHRENIEDKESYLNYGDKGYENAEDSNG